jgi:hypothetical protein
MPRPSSPARLGLALLLLTGGLSVAFLGATGLSRWLQENKVRALTKVNAAQLDIPAVDAAVPSRTETATFALG